MNKTHFVEVSLHNRSAKDLGRILSSRGILSPLITKPFRVRSSGGLTQLTGGGRFYMAFVSKFEVRDGTLVAVLDCDQLTLDYNSSDAQEDLSLTDIQDGTPALPICDQWEGNIPSTAGVAGVPIFMNGFYGKLTKQSDVE
jgi:hypothetical protein